MNSRRDIIFYCIFVVLGFVGILPLVLRNQHQITQPKSDVWPKLTACKAHCGIDKHTWKMRCDIAYTPETKEMEGKQVTLDGFILPLESTASFHHFLLSVRAPSCPYCPPGGPNELVEVFSTTPMVWSDQSISMRGALKLAEPHNDTGIFFQLLDAMDDPSFAAEDTPAASSPTAVTVKPLSAYRFTDLDGTRQDISVSQWVGKPLLVSFWRSDCAPCLHEMKVLPAIAKQHPNLSVALISLQDAVHMREHLPAMPKNIHPLVAQADGRELLNAFGNDRTLALPYSMMLDGTGAVCGKHYGIITPEKINEWWKQCNPAE